LVDYGPDDAMRIESTRSNEMPPIIRDGVLLSGTFSKKDLGTSRGNLIHHLALQLGNKECVAILSMMSQVCNHYLTITHGFSLDLDDCNPTRQRVHHPDVEITLDNYRTIHTENMIRTDSIMKTVPDNAFQLMMTSGSKGGLLNATQIMCGLGPQDVSGRPVPLYYGDRSLPCFPPGAPLVALR
jgi:hypothetical protein